MSDAKRFEGPLRTDEAPQAKLRAAMEAFEEDGADEAAFFESVIAPLAVEGGGACCRAG